MAKSGRKVVGFTDDGLVRVQEAWGGESTVMLTTLTRPELVAAASVKFPNVGGNKWLSARNTEIVTAIQTGEVPQVVTEERKLNGYATPKQLAFINKLGGSAGRYTSKQDAADMISQLLAEKEQKDQEQQQAVPQADPELVRLIEEEEEIERRIREAAQPATQSIDVASVINQAVAKCAELFDPELNTLHKVTARDGEAIAQLAQTVADLVNQRPKVIEVTINESPTVTVEGNQHECFPDVLRALGCKLNVYLVGPAGTGKSTIAKNASKTLGLKYGAISLDPTMPPSRIFGYQDASGNYVPTVFRQIFEQGGVFLFDEMDNGHPGILASINMAISNGVCAFPDGMVEKSDDFRCVAAANTHGTGPTRQFVGRNQLDAATLDRFVEIEVSYDETLETSLALAEYDAPITKEWINKVRQYRYNAQKYNVLSMFTPRASIDGARMLRAGFGIEQVTRMRLDKGIDADTLRKLNEAGVR